MRGDRISRDQKNRTNRFAPKTGPAARGWLCRGLANPGHSNAGEGMGNFFSKLKRRHVYRVAAAYVVVAWVAIQAVNNLAPMRKQEPSGKLTHAVLVPLNGLPG